MKGEIQAPHRSVEEVDITAALKDDAGATATSSDSTVAAAVETPVKEAPVKEVTVLAQVESERRNPPNQSQKHMWRWLKMRMKWSKLRN